MAAKKAITEWVNPPKQAPVDAMRDKVSKLHDIADATATCGYVASFVAGNAASIEQVTSR